MNNNTTHRIVDRCGIIPAVDPVDSFVLSDKLMSIFSYQMMTKYDWRELSTMTATPDSTFEEVVKLLFYCRQCQHVIFEQCWIDKYDIGLYWN